MEGSKYHCEVLGEEQSKYDLSFKMILIGDSGVGKSALSIKAARDDFQEYYNATVGFEFLSFHVKINDTIIRLQIWDTCGQEAYKSLISSFFKSSSLAVIVYSIDNADSFQHVSFWLNEVKNQSNPGVRLFLIGNKLDLQDKREVSLEQGQQLSDEHKFDLFMESSAKTGENAQQVFVKAAEILYEDHLKYVDLKGPEGLKKKKEDNKQKLMPTPKNEGNQKGGCC